MKSLRRAVIKKDRGLDDNPWVFLLAIMLPMFVVIAWVLIAMGIASWINGCLQ